MKSLAIEIPASAVREFCQKHDVQRMALFGSVLRDDFTMDSDVDVLVEFKPHARVGLIRFAQLEDEFSAILGRRAEFTTFDALNKYFRDEVLGEAEPIFDASSGAQYSKCGPRQD